MIQKKRTKEMVLEMKQKIKKKGNDKRKIKTVCAVTPPPALTDALKISFILPR